jgi:hypothetical protein
MPDRALPHGAGQAVERAYPTGTLYGVCIAVGDRRVYLPLGHERDGWNLELAARVLAVVSTACGDRRAVCCAQRRRRRWRG